MVIGEYYYVLYFFLFDYKSVTISCRVCNNNIIYDLNGDYTQICQVSVCVCVCVCREIYI